LHVQRAGLRNLKVWHATCWHNMGSGIKGRTSLSRYDNLALFLTAACVIRVLRDTRVSIIERDSGRARSAHMAVPDYRSRSFGIGPATIY
jgi:hypothetical protein